MPKSLSIRSVSVEPYEVLLQGDSIVVDTSVPMDAQSAQGGLQILGDASGRRGPLGRVKLSHGGRKATWTALAPLAEGAYRLIVDGLAARQPSVGPSAKLDVPFFVVASRSRISRGVKVLSFARLQLGRLDVRRLRLGTRPAGRYIELMKAENRRTGRPVQLAYDARGRRVNAERMLGEIEAARAAKFGRLHEHLHARLARATARTSLDVAIWLRAPEPAGLNEVKSSRRRSRGVPPLVRRHRMDTEALTARYVAHLRTEFRVRRPAADPLAPVVYARLTKTQIRQLQRDRNVAGIFLHDESVIDDLKDSIAIANTDDVHSDGHKGKGIRVAVWENGPDKKDDLSIAGFYDSGESQKSAHARLTCAVVKNREKGKPHGHAPSCLLYSANSGSIAALAWAVMTKECTVISQSFHRLSEASSETLSFDDVYKDWLATHYPYPTILQASGNYSSGDVDGIDPPEDEYVNHKGYCSLAVGNHNDSASAVAGNSVFRNPSTPHGDRELPEICANGTGVSAVGLAKSGTSLAAPAVAGIAACLQGRQALLKSWPEGCRAILLAGATRNVSGSTWWQDVVAGVDASDGSGAVDAEESMAISGYKRQRNAAATQRGWDVGTLESRDFGRDRKSNFVYRVRVEARKLRHVKVALAWNSQVTFNPSSCIRSELTLNFDLMIYNKKGQLVAYSGSWDNSYEVAEFTGTPGEVYRIKIRRWPGTGDSRYGIAWTVTGP